MMEGVYGLDELVKKFDNMADYIDDPDLENGMKKVGDVLRNEIKAVTPIGPRGRTKQKNIYVAGMKVGEETVEKSGNLKRSWRSKKFKRKIKGSPAVYVANDRKLAPHSHLVEFGHGGPHPAPPHPFVRPTVDKFRGEYPRLMNDMLRDKLQLHITPTFEMIASSL